MNEGRARHSRHGPPATCGASNVWCKRRNDYFSASRKAAAGVPSPVNEANQIVPAEAVLHNDDRPLANRRSHSGVGLA